MVSYYTCIGSKSGLAGVWNSHWKDGGDMEAFERIKKIISECEEDLRKAVGGNKAAQTRVRKSMQEIKDAAQQVRVGMLEARESEVKKD